MHSGCSATSGRRIRAPIRPRPFSNLSDKHHVVTTTTSIPPQISIPAFDATTRQFLPVYIRPPRPILYQSFIPQPTNPIPEAHPIPDTTPPKRRAIMP
ncbi:hypothetical protein BS50DRAFT_569857 [Corynespora cassiicola Philippines]|uniref:Uncharacterized protein n=1 Tax=Corynespora cassiicola Philippines TaxID=1448308 RepID=A0A2T2P3T2_CORCC|nr:hypothetical protein BS50DRAFT_569857 [Corynespora cassiicola Philippines]